ncbi:MAG TPA: hypothetical protein VKW77_04710 [Acidimicrobiales bacterium]|nr:hypothetical protein [Acidimicrobiales bacterium]
MDARPVRLDVVMARWCPHCYPLSVDQGKILARDLDVPLRLLDIDRPAEETVADELVRLYGDWDPDYLIPQVFLTWSDGRVQHLLTGTPGSVAATHQSWDRVRAHLGHRG